MNGMDGGSLDARGSQRNIGRLIAFDLGAFIHMLFYRILIFASIAIGIALLVSILLYPSLLSMQTAETMVLTVWILITPQVYASARAAAIIFSRGRASDYINSSFASFASGNGTTIRFYKSLPSVVLAAWVLGFVLSAALWLS